MRKIIDLAKVKELIRNRNWATVKTALSSQDASDIADLFRETDVKDCTIILRLLPQKLQSEVFSELDSNIQERILKNLSDDHIKSIIMELDPDDRTELFEDMPPNLTRRLINLLSSNERRKALELLGYPKESVGRLMTPDYVAIKDYWTIQRSIEHIRSFGKDAETIDVVYVVDDEWHLLDNIPIRRLILASPKQSVKTIMDNKFISVNADADQEEAIRLFEKYGLVVLPVVDRQNHLLGIVTVDDIIDAIRNEETEDFTKFAAIETKPNELEFITRIKEVPLSKIYKARIVWLLTLLGMDFITGSIIQGFERLIATYVVLVTFLPVLVDTAGNAGSQSATLVIRALALGTVKTKDWLYLLGRELIVASALGITMGMGISVMGIIRGKSLTIAAVVVLAMLVNVIIGSLIGVILPFIFAKLKKDPATASTPLITTLADIVGTAIYLGIARLILG